ncbi:MAG: extracellular solute-binding protein [Gammaproteobacteria bacterium]|jgi:phosphoglycerate transport regulatory protein PgtC|nr:extracellular solute-binding protein [Gammaproteobacteria bacterium]MBU0826856.1 extracellular solute-binding protein [Gammaproteobacteria bacterium]MBU0891360.1 extracellular solute-binding protein [Gammaproteobacteria bacterium]MBU1352880.1 extracellular solute-binding protein [Gammaproteobacteria bacterium]MBU1505678.1 extracellular solute-binding protein [Gammaproteobacteria bacterium]
MQRILCAGALAAGLFVQGAQAGTVTVLTSFPKELTTAYQKAFEARNPGIKVEILNKNTTAAIAYVRELPEGQRPDIMWASAPDAFEVLARNKLLQAAPDTKNPAAPAKIGNYPLNDPQGLYYGQALAGYGIMWNTRYLQANKLPAPKEWADLTRPEYFGHVAISSPSRSGTTQLTVETILQGEGWDKGWSQLLAMMGNAAAVTDRSFAVPDGVNNGQYGIGIVIDFFGLAGKYSGFPVDFVYPAMTAVVPANIALIAGGKNTEEAKKFMAFSMSTEGQQLLFDPKISRLPILPYSSLKAPPGYPVPQDVAKRAKVQFDAVLSESRYQVVTSLFDQMVTFRLKELQGATKAIQDAEKALKAKPNAKGSELVRQARDVAYAPLVGESNVKNEEFLELFRKNRRDVAVSKQLTGLEQLWATKSRENYERARSLAEQAKGMAK